MLMPVNWTNWLEISVVFWPNLYHLVNLEDGYFL